MSYSKAWGVFIYSGKNWYGKISLYANAKKNVIGLSEKNCRLNSLCALAICIYFLFLSKLRYKHWWQKTFHSQREKNHTWRWQFFAESNFARIEKDHPWPLCTILNNNKAANCPQNNCATWMKAKTRFAWEKQNTTSAFYQICESSNCKKRKAEWQW